MLIILRSKYPSRTGTETHVNQDLSLLSPSRPPPPPLSYQKGAPWINTNQDLAAWPLLHAMVLRGKKEGKYALRSLPLCLSQSKTSSSFATWAQRSFVLCASCPRLISISLRIDQMMFWHCAVTTQLLSQLKVRLYSFFWYDCVFKNFTVCRTKVNEIYIKRLNW